MSLGLGGIFASWWIYVPPVASASFATAVGLGLLSVLASIVLGQRRWDKAQQIFWKEWSRSTDMMRGDLQVRYSSVCLLKDYASADIQGCVQLRTGHPCRRQVDCRSRRLGTAHCSAKSSIRCGGEQSSRTETKNTRLERTYVVFWEATVVCSPSPISPSTAKYNSPVEPNEAFCSTSSVGEAASASAGHVESRLSYEQRTGAVVLKRPIYSRRRSALVQLTSPDQLVVRQ